MSIGVVQIGETGPGTYPPLVCQPLRSPKSPYARYRPGSSSTLPPKLNARIKGQTLVPPGRIKAPRNISNKLNGCPKDTSIDIRNTIPSSRTSEDITKPLPKLFIHSPKDQSQSDNDRLTLTKPIYDVVDDQSATMEVDDLRQMRSEIGACVKHLNSDEVVSNKNETIATTTTNNNASLIEENSNSSDQTCGYFSEDSYQSITDICGSSLELKVQIKQCSDEKILEKDLSERSLFQADYISRPNEKCKFT